jgi:hypothetical protein
MGYGVFARALRQTDGALDDFCYLARLLKRPAEQGGASSRQQRAALTYELWKESYEQA